MAPGATFDGVTDLVGSRMERIPMSTLSIAVTVPALLVMVAVLNRVPLPVAVTFTRILTRPWEGTVPRFQVRGEVEEGAGTALT